MYRSPIKAGQTEAHLNDPTVISKLQEAAATNRRVAHPAAPPAETRRRRLRACPDGASM